MAATHHAKGMGDKAPGPVLARIAFPILLAAAKAKEHFGDLPIADCLRALAENADLFVIAWLSAKHAATDFIREHRAERPLLYAQGRGFSSILRALDEFLR